MRSAIWAAGVGGTGRLALKSEAGRVARVGGLEAFDDLQRLL